MERKKLPPGLCLSKRRIFHIRRRSGHGQSSGNYCRRGGPMWPPFDYGCAGGGRAIPVRTPDSSLTMLELAGSKILEIIGKCLKTTNAPERSDARRGEHVSGCHELNCAFRRVELGGDNLNIHRRRDLEAYREKRAVRFTFNAHDADANVTA